MNNCDKDKMLKKIEQLETKIRVLKDSLTEKNEQLEVIYNSKTWRLGQLYARFLGLESSWRKWLSNWCKFLGFYKGSKGFGNARDMSFQVQDIHYRKVFTFINGDGSSKGIFVTIAGPKIRVRVGHKGYQVTHRAINLAKEFSRAGYKIIYVYEGSWGMTKLDRIENIDEKMIQMHIGLFARIYGQVMKKCDSEFDNKILLIQSLHPSVVEILGHANASNWRTVYDILDNWEEFARAGWMSEWYSWGLEEFVINNSDVRIAVSWFIRDKLRGYKNLYLVHNGCSLSKRESFTVDLPKGEVSVGYIGNLEPYRFDWDLLFLLAEKRRQWLFYLIGKLPKNIRVRKNIVSLGIVEPDELYSYANNWNVGIVPFKVNNLTVSCDNIKVYEYLFFGLPVVARGIGEHMKEYPHVHIAEEREEFEELITKAASESINKNKIEDFLESATWENRAKQMLHCILQSTVTYKECLNEASVYP